LDSGTVFLGLNCL